jgi:kynurenine formamidase
MPPSFNELKRPDATGLPLAWGVWGAADQIGTLNNITPEATAQAARLVRRGVRFNLNLPLHEPLGLIGPGAHRIRRAPEQTLFKATLAGLLIRDDKLDELFLQASTQWDGLSHVGDPQHGFYNGVQPDGITQREGTRLGVEHYVAFGIATRGVLVDLPRFYAARGRAWSAMGSQVASAADISDALAACGVRLQRGDVLLVRTGWISAFRAASDAEARDRLFRGRDYSGLSGGPDMWELLWDSGVAAVASDSVTVETWPLRDNAPSLHLAIARLGLVLGEMFDLDALAEDCVATGVHECFFVSAPLNLRGGVGSPANALAIK